MKTCLAKDDCIYTPYKHGFTLGEELFVDVYWIKSVLIEILFAIIIQLKNEQKAWGFEGQNNKKDLKTHQLHIRAWLMYRTRTCNNSFCNNREKKLEPKRAKITKTQNTADQPPERY